MPDARRLIHKTPCRECPWRIEAPAGWLGGNTAETYADIVSSNEVASCHLRDYGPGSPDTAFCVGSLTTARNACIMPHQPDRAIVAARSIEPDPAYFKNPEAFYAHHTGGGAFVRPLMRRLTGQKSTEGAIS